MLPPHACAPDHTQLLQPHTRAKTTSNWDHQTRGYQSHPIAITTHLGTQSHLAATATHAGTKQIQLSSPITWTPTTYNCHRQTRGYQSYPIAITTHLGTQSHPAATATHAGTNHIQLAIPNSWVPITSNCHHHTLGHPSTPSCHSHTRGHQPHPTGNTNLVGTNHI